MIRNIRKRIVFHEGIDGIWNGVAVPTDQSDTAFGLRQEILCD